MIFYQNTIKKLAAIKRHEDNRAASFSLRVSSEKHRFFAYMVSLSSGRPSLNTIVCREKEEDGRNSMIHHS